MALIYLPLGAGGSAELAPASASSARRHVAGPPSGRERLAHLHKHVVGSGTGRGRPRRALRVSALTVRAPAVVCRAARGIGHGAGSDQ